MNKIYYQELLCDAYLTQTDSQTATNINLLLIVYKSSYQT